MPPPASSHWHQREIWLRMPFISASNGGMPPDATGWPLSGTKPSVREANPGLIPICEACGIGRINPPPALAANAIGNRGGGEDFIIAKPPVRLLPGRRPASAD